LGGLATLITSPLVGRWVDRVGAVGIFTFAGIAGIPMIAVITQLSHVSLFVALIVTTLFFIVSNGRMVPSMTLVTSAVPPKRRGGFMSLNSCFQQLFAGLAAMIAGLIVTRGEDGSLLHFERVGYFAIVFSVITMAIARRVKPYSDKTA
jgi:predicted MFS family arabinose efflux permease